MPTSQIKPSVIGRSYNVQEAPIQKLLAEVKIPYDVVSLGQGVPFFGPPTEAIAAAARGLADECCYRYTEDAGLLSLRRVIANKLKTENNISAVPEINIMVTSGGNQAFINVLMAITDIGDEVILLAPYYFNHLMALQFTGCKPVLVKTNESYQPEPENIFQRFTKKTKAIITISPNNPTGAVYSKSVLEKINKFCTDQNIYHISDEAYENFVFEDTKHFSPGSFDTELLHTISIFSFSKSYSMAGYRVGYMVYPSVLQNELLKVQDTIGICPPGPSQSAGEAALKLGSAYPRKFLPEMVRVRELIIEKLRTLDILELPVTKGGFYFFIKLKTSKRTWEIAKKLISDFGVITIPGEVFGSRTPSLRISYGNLTLEQAEIGVERLISGLEKLL